MADNATGLGYLSQRVGTFQAGIESLQEVLSEAQADAPQLNGRLARYLRCVLPEAYQGLTSQLPMLLTHKFPESLGVALFAPGGRPLLVNESFSTVFPFPWRLLSKEIPSEFKLYLCQKGQLCASGLELWPWHTMDFQGRAHFLRLARGEENSYRYFDMALYQVGQGAQAQESAATLGFVLEADEEVALEMRMAESRQRLLVALGEFKEPAARLSALVERAKKLPGLAAAAANAGENENEDEILSEREVSGEIAAYQLTGASQEITNLSQPLEQTSLALADEEYPRGYIAVEERALEQQVEPETLPLSLETVEEFVPRLKREVPEDEPQPNLEPQEKQRHKHNLEFHFSPEAENEIPEDEPAHESSDVMLESIQEIIEDSILQSIHEPATEPLEQVTFNAAPVADEEDDDYDESQLIASADNEDLLSVMAVAEFDNSHWHEESSPVVQEALNDETVDESACVSENEEGAALSFEDVNLEQSTQSDVTALWQEYSDFEPPASHLEEEMVELLEPELAQEMTSQGEEISTAYMEGEQSTGAKAEAEAEVDADADADVEVDANVNVEAAPNLKCLVVDDIPVNQKLVVLQLKRLGYKPDLASNGLEAIKLIEQNDYAMIFMDLDMPYMNGFEATREIRKRELLTTGHLPVIGMVSYEREGERRSCIDGGMDDCMVKGVEANCLKQLIDGVLTRCAHQASESSGALSLAALEEEELPCEEKQCREVKQFIENMNDVVSRMQKLVDSRDTQQIEKSGATVTGSLQVLNLSHIEIVLDEIIRLAHKGDWPQVRLKYLKLKTLYMRSQAELKKQHPSAFNEMASH